MANEEKIIAYKGFDKDLKCHGGFQYELDKEYEMDGPIKACSRGFALSGGSAACGANGVAVAKGLKPKAKGGEGAVLVLIVTDDYGKLVSTKTVTVGKTYKADTWYTVKDGRVCKVKE